MKIGKLPPEMLSEMVLAPAKKAGIRRSEVIVRPALGEDCAVVGLGDECCVLSTDPITGAKEEIGYLAVQINCNDAAASGAEPIGLLATVLLPEDSSRETIEIIMNGLLRGSKEWDVELLGGHTEVTAAVNQPVVSCTVVAKVKKGEFLSSGAGKPGQDLILTKWSGLEGTAILAKEYPSQCLQVLNHTELQEAQQLYSLLSVKKESRVAVQFGATALHDATEGGVLGAAWEMAECSHCGVTIDCDAIPVLPITKKICDAVGINPFCLISSGCLLIASQNGNGLVAALQQAGIAASVIGALTKKDKILLQNGEQKTISEPKRDELYRAYELWNNKGGNL